MTPLELRTLVAKLPEQTLITEAFEAQGYLQSSYLRMTWYRSQKEHWLGWLGDYDGPGAYGRKSTDRDARFVYNHFQCPPGLLWLAEAVGVEKALLVAGRDAIIATQKNPASQCAAFRRVVPWEVVEQAIKQRAGSESSLGSFISGLKRRVSDLAALNTKKSQ